VRACLCVCVVLVPLDPEQQSRGQVRDGPHHVHPQLDLLVPPQAQHLQTQQRELPGVGWGGGQAEAVSTEQGWAGREGAKAGRVKTGGVVKSGDLRGGHVEG
jgi:hypothetical protein